MGDKSEGLETLKGLLHIIMIVMINPSYADKSDAVFLKVLGFFGFNCSRNRIPRAKQCMISPQTVLALRGSYLPLSNWVCLAGFRSRSRSRSRVLR